MVDTSNSAERVTEEQATAHVLAYLTRVAAELGAGWSAAAREANANRYFDSVQHTSGAALIMATAVQRYRIDGTIRSLVAPSEWKLKLPSAAGERNEITYKANSDGLLNVAKINQRVAERARLLEQRAVCREAECKAAAESSAKEKDNVAAVRATLLVMQEPLIGVSHLSEYQQHSVLLAGHPAGIKVSAAGATVSLTVSADRLAAVLKALAAVL